MVLYLVYVDGQWLHVDVSDNDLSGRNGVLLVESYLWSNPPFLTILPIIEFIRYEHIQSLAARDATGAIRGAVRGSHGLVTQGLAVCRQRLRGGGHPLLHRQQQDPHLEPRVRGRPVAPCGRVRPWETWIRSVLICWLLFGLSMVEPSLLDNFANHRIYPV